MGRSLRLWASEDDGTVPHLGLLLFPSQLSIGVWKLERCDVASVKRKILCPWSL